jgi:hypothetical protein
MSELPGPATADDVASLVDSAVASLSTRLDRDWHVPAGSLDWTCWETVEHVSNSILYYAAQMVPMASPATGPLPLDYQGRRPGGPDDALYANPEAGTFGLLRVLNACGGILVSLVRTTSPATRAHHMWGRSDPEGFGAMGVVEVAVHVHDMSGALELEWAPAEDLCDRTLRRLFPDAPTDTERWPTLLWATGRTELPGHPQLQDWRWYSQPH